MAFIVVILVVVLLGILAKLLFPMLGRKVVCKVLDRREIGLADEPEIYIQLILEKKSGHRFQVMDCIKNRQDLKGIHRGDHVLFDLKTGKIVAKLPQKAKTLG